MQRAVVVALGLVAILGAGAGDAASPPPVATHGPRTRPVVALTIDDGADPALCARIVDILVQRRIPATFFPVAEWTELDPALWHRIAAIGFPIGNHTATHRLLGKLSLSAQTAEIQDGARRIEAASGAPLIPVLRPPGGSWNADTRTAAARAGERLVLLWDTTFADTSKSDSNPQHYIDRGTAGRNGSVILLHCWPKITPEILGPIIDDYLARGFRFVTIPELFGLPGPTPDFTSAAALASPSPGSSAATASPSPQSASPSASGLDPSTSPPASAGSAGSTAPSAAPASATPDAGDARAVGLIVVILVAAALAALLVAGVRRRRRAG